MESLQADIGKLFVVWNLDADCAELQPMRSARGKREAARRSRRRARALPGRRARRVPRRGRRGDTKHRWPPAGCEQFTAALGRFASSDKRQVAALREARKRAQKWIDEAQRLLAERRKALDAQARRHARAPAEGAELGRRKRQRGARAVRRVSGGGRRPPASSAPPRSAQAGRDAASRRFARRGAPGCAAAASPSCSPRSRPPARPTPSAARPPTASPSTRCARPPRSSAR